MRESGSPPDAYSPLSACDDCIFVDQFIARRPLFSSCELVVLLAGRVHPVIVGWSTRNRPLLPRPINDTPLMLARCRWPRAAPGETGSQCLSGVAASRAWQGLDHYAP